MKHKDGLIYEEVELPTPFIGDGLRASLEAFVVREGCALVANAGGTYTIVDPGGGRLTVGLVWEEVNQG